MRERIALWSAIFQIYLKDTFAYRASLVIWMLSDTVPAMLMPVVMIASMPAGGEIAGFTASQFVGYYLVMLLLTNFITSHLMWDLSFEIKEGVFTTYLLRPISYFETVTVRNLAWRCGRILVFLPALALLMIFYRKHLPDIQLYLGLEMWLAVLLGHLVSFAMAYTLTSMALYFTEVHSIFGLYYIPMLFLSGQMFPIALLPPWVISFAKLLPFYYTTALPVEIAVGRVSPADSRAMLLIQLAWIFGSLSVGRYLWRRGLKHYTAVGM